MTLEIVAKLAAATLRTELSAFDDDMLLTCLLSSSVLTMLLIIVDEVFRMKSNREWKRTTLT